MNNIIFYGVHGLENIRELKKHTIELQDKDYDTMRRVLDAIMDLHREPLIIAEKLTDESRVTKEDINWFIENRCNWENVQYRNTDGYYVIPRDGIHGQLLFCIVPLKQVIYSNTRQMKIMIMQDYDLTDTEGINSVSGYKEITSDSQEFKDAYIVVSREQ